MKPRRIMFVLAGVLVSGGLNAANGQETAPAQAPQDTSVQGYVPSAPAPTAAPEPAAAPATAPAAASAAATAEALKALGFVEIISARSVERIQREMDQAKLDEREADADISAKQQQAAEAKAMVEVKKQEVSSLEARRKLADKGKQEAEKVTLEAEKKDAERHKQFLERRVALHQAERESAKAEKSRAEARQKALEIEMELARRRADRERLADTGPAATLRQDNVIRELERSLLEARRVDADREKQVADKHVDIARRRLDLYQAQTAAAGNR